MTTNMKKIELEIPEGKRAEWVDGVLTLVDEKTQDITERIKTFEDACNELGDDHHFVIHYKEYYHYVNNKYLHDAANDDILAYLKLRIITCALNEGWEPKFEEFERRWIVGCDTLNGTYLSENSYHWVTVPNELVLKSEKLADYAASQYRDIYADFCGRKKGGEG